MFDRTIIQAPTSLRVDATFTEKRAPTDESVKLLREMEAHAKAEVIKAVAVQDNQFSGVLHLMRDLMSAQEKFRLIYSINGKKLTTDYSVDDFDKSPEVWVPGLIEAVARDIAVEILQKPVAAAVAGVLKT